jgi:cyanobactin maturation PatA/PatG family protease
MKTAPHDTPNIDEPATLLRYLERPGHLNKAASILWTLKLDESPIYAIKPVDAFASEIYEDYLVGALKDQLNPAKQVERVSVPGVITGKVRLFTGETVPVIAPEVRGMYSWDVGGLIEAVRKVLKQEKPKQGEADDLGENIRGFFDRVYFEMRNLGATPQERALNYAATDALQVSQVFQAVHVDPKYKGYQLDSIAVERSPICRPESDCWDVKLIFFNPADLQTARYVFRFTIDVSDIMPVMIGQIRSWPLR